ncbi:MAG: 3-deoxy-D-manno-octulosonic acid transferase [Verrucomicrobia bacterium]|nr:3-deoxy-D-manno-octulosonic acid transferase [Verrucomicrobiota bacterium]
MFRALYNTILLLLLPLWLWKEKKRARLAERIGLKLPSLPLADIWIHAVSMGETRAVITLVAELQKTHSIVFSTTTETGLAAAQKLFPNIAGHFLLPIDFSWNIRRLRKKIQPNLLILVESDFWYNLITLGAPKVALVNGKISEKSAQRFARFKSLARLFFEPISLLCVQSDEYKDRFLKIAVPASKIVVTGNLKLDAPIPSIDKAEWKSRLGIRTEDRVITLGSTHDPEEELLLSVLAPLPVKILLVPRHPERFNAVAELLAKKNISFVRYSSEKQDPKAQVVLVDAMGLLNTCYGVSDLAIVCGSFTERVGGHNIFEPIALGVPTIFGPHMQTQKELVDLVLRANAGRQVPIEELKSVVAEFLKNPPTAMTKAGQELARKSQGATKRTLEAFKWV